MATSTQRLRDAIELLQSMSPPEMALFEKLLYKNKNQHRRGVYYQRLLEVRE
jgi:hypothetical protein